ncbi:MAG: hypothetical protein QM750_06265 [Rubrivivax sp.]
MSDAAMPPPLLPPDRRVERGKIEDYLLHPTKGRGKAAFFEAFGFSLADWGALRDALLEHAATNPVAEAVVSPWGTRYSVRGGLRTPDGRQPPPVVCSVWQSDGGSPGVRLITAYPD